MAKPQFEFLDVNRIGWTLINAEGVVLVRPFFAEMTIGEGSLHDLTLNQSLSKAHMSAVRLA